jgi:hypothetical protein
MKERPILFSAPMVRALLDGSKTQTRRIMKPQPEPVPDKPGEFWWPCNAFQSMVTVSSTQIPEAHGMAGDACPYGGHRERLWVREAYADIGCRLTYRADEDDGARCKVKKWTPSIHMFRADSRILLEIISVRVEQLQSISETDARAEGVHIEDRHKGGYCAGEFLPPSIRAFRELWESINGAESWNANPWVWAVEFKRVLP